MSLRSPRYLPQVLFVLLGIVGACSLQVPDEKDVFSDDTAVGGKHTGGNGGKAGSTSTSGGSENGGATSGGTSSTDIGGVAGSSGTTTAPSGGVAGTSGSGIAGAGRAGANNGGVGNVAGTPSSGGTSALGGTTVGVGGASGASGSTATGGIGGAAGSSSGGGTSGAGGSDTAGTAGNAGLGGTAGAAGYAGGLVGTGGFIDPLSVGLVHHFKFDGNLTDTIEPTKTGTLAGGAGITTASCKFGSCIQVRQSGSVDWVDLPAGLLSGLNATTISMWALTLSNMRRGAKAYDFGSGTGTNVFVAPHGTNPATTLTGAEFGGVSGGLTFVDLWGEGDFSSSSTTPIWHLFTVTWDATQITFYVDGTSRSTKASPGTLPSGISASPNMLGKGINDSTGMYARFDDLRIYNYVLPQELITGLYTML